MKAMIRCLCCLCCLVLGLSSTGLHAANAHEEGLLKKRQLDRLCRIAGENFSIKKSKFSFLYDEYVIAVDDERCGIELRYSLTVYRSASWAKDELQEAIEIVSLGNLQLIKPYADKAFYYAETSPSKALFLIQHNNMYLNISYSLKNHKKPQIRTFVRLLKNQIAQVYKLQLEQSGF